MKTLEIIGYKRANLGKQFSKKLRYEAMVPGVLYGGSTQVHFYTPMAVLKDLIYTPKAYFITFNLEGVLYTSILQDIQFHPVSEMILHIDLLQISEKKEIKMQIPTKLVGNAPGVVKGGNLAHKMKKLWVVAYPKDMPDEIEVDISTLDVGQMVRVSNIMKTGQYAISALPGTPVVVLETTRAIRADVAEAKTDKK